MQNKYRWIQLGVFLVIEFILGAQLIGVLRSIKNSKSEITKLLQDPVNLLSFKHYLTAFDFSDVPNLLLYGLMGWTLISGTKHALSGKIKTRGNYDSVPEFGSAGTAKWMDDQEIKKIFFSSQAGLALGSVTPNKEEDKDGNRFVPFKQIGTYATLVGNEGKNENIFIFGPSGSNKTVAFVLPAIYRAMDLGESIVTTDLKGELHEFTRKDLEKRGYKVYVLDFIKRRRGNHWNPIMTLSMDEEDEILKTANAFVQGSKVAQEGKQKSGGDPMWENAEASLLAALIGYVLQLYPKEDHKFETVIKVLHSLKNSAIAEEIFEINGVTGAPLSWYNDFLLTADSEKMRAGIIGGLAINLSKLSSAGIKAIISKNDFMFEDIAKEKTAVFLMIPPNDKTFASFITVFWQQFLDKLYNFAFENGNKLPVKVRVILEEKANIGRIATLPQVTSTSRGLGLKLNIVYQDANQPKEQYGEVWESIASNCDTWLVLGVNDNTTAKYLSEKISNTTVKVQNTSTSKDGNQLVGSKSASESYNYQQRALIDMGEIQRLPVDRVIIMPRGKDPVMLYKIQYQHWKYRFCEPTPYHSLPLLIPEDPEVEETPKVEETGKQVQDQASESRQREANQMEEVVPSEASNDVHLEEVAAASEEVQHIETQENEQIKEEEESTPKGNRLTMDELLGKKGKS